MFQIHGIKYRDENELDREAMNTVADRISQALRKILIQLSLQAPCSTVALYP